MEHGHLRACGTPVARRGILENLGTLGPGDVVHVTRSDGRTVEVVSVSRHPKDQFLTDGPAPGAELRLITCGGRFDPVTKAYRDNVVVPAVHA